MKNISLITITLLLFLTGSITAFDTDSHKKVAFSDTSKQIRMPADWQSNPIKHEPAYADADLVIVLDGQMFLAWEPLIQKYAKEHNLKIVTSRGTCGVSAGGLSNKTIDIGAFCCPPGFIDRLPGLKFHTAGIAAISLLVHAENPVSNITLDQARQIFQGSIHRWSEISSKNPDILIQPIARLHCKLRPGHWKLILNNKDLFSPDLFEVGAIPDMISQVAINPGAIGYEVSWMAGYHREKGNVKIIKINGLHPDQPSNLISGAYPFYRVYSFSTWEDKKTKNPHAQKLVKHILEQSKHIDSRFNLIPASALRGEGWKFRETELVGEPFK